MSDEFVPISVAARQTGYTYTMVHRLQKRGIIRSRQFYGRPIVALADVIAYHEKMQALGSAKHNLRYRQEAPDATTAA